MDIWDANKLVLFIAFVLAGFFYVIKKGALKWDQ